MCVIAYILVCVCKCIVLCFCILQGVVVIISHDAFRYVRMIYYYFYLLL